jgi:hypothetical protein
VFNDGSFKKGGRFYSAWWHSIPREYRKFITINDHSTEEHDYCEIHPNIAYAIERVIPPGKHGAYVLDGYESNKPLRNLVKKILLRSFNAASRDVMLYMAKNEQEVNRQTGKKEKVFNVQDMLPEIGSFEGLFNLIELKHPMLMDKYIYHDKGKDLMFLDSRLAEMVMLSYLDKSCDEFAILPIHDSFITIGGEPANLLKDCMRECSIALFGVEIGTDRKEAVLKFESDEHPELYARYYDFLSA